MDVKKEMPFSMAVAKSQIEPDVLEGSLLVNSAIDAAKKILLQNRVQNFQAADVVSVARLIIEYGAKDSQ